MNIIRYKWKKQYQHYKYNRQTKQFNAKAAMNIGNNAVTITAKITHESMLYRIHENPINEKAKQAYRKRYS